MAKVRASLSGGSGGKNAEYGTYSMTTSQEYTIPFNELTYESGDIIYAYFEVSGPTDIRSSFMNNDVIYRDSNAHYITSASANSFKFYFSSSNKTLYWGLIKAN